MPLSPDEVAAAFVSYQRPILAFCAQRVGDATAAEDVAGEVWEDFLQAAQAYEDRGHSVSALLFRIARSRCVDYLRRQHRRPAVPLSARLAAPAPDVDGTLDMAALLRRVAQQRPDYAAVLIAKAAGVTDVEIAARLGVSHGAVKALAHRARAAALKLRSSPYGIRREGPPPPAEAGRHPAP